MFPSGKDVITVGDSFWTWLTKKTMFLQKSRKIISRTYVCFEAQQQGMARKGKSM
jgi:hypothetical protein